MEAACRQRVTCRQLASPSCRKLAKKRQGYYGEDKLPASTDGMIAPLRSISQLLFTLLLLSLLGNRSIPTFSFARSFRCDR